MVIEGAIVVEDSGIVGVELEKWVEFEGPSPWVDWSFPCGSTNFGSNLGFGQSYWDTVKGRGYLNFARVRWDIVS